jgi:predicted transcriptional regulator
MAHVAGKNQISIRTPNEVIEALDKIAAILERDRTWVMLRAFKLYLAGEGLEVMQDAAGLASLNRGEGIPLDRVMDKIDAKIAQAMSRKAS